MLHLDLRKLRWGTMALASMLALGAVDARAITVSFGDSTRYWDGYANGTIDDTRDTIGTPDLRGGTATFDDDRAPPDQHQHRPTPVTFRWSLPATAA